MTQRLRRSGSLLLASMAALWLTSCAGSGNHHRMPRMSDAAFRELVLACGHPGNWERNCPALDNWLSDAAANCGVQD